MSVSFESDVYDRLRLRPFDVYKFENFINEHIPQNVFRAKGILWFSDNELRHIFQLTGLRYNLNADQWHSPEKNQLVFIGKNLAVNQIHSQLQKCLV